MNSREKVELALEHKSTGTIPVDFGSTAITGIHCLLLEKLRDYYKLPSHPIKIIDTFQMLGEVEQDMADLLGIDCVGVFGRNDIFNHDTSVVHEQITPWGQKVIVPKDMEMDKDKNGDIYVYASGDKGFPPSAIMPDGCYFINAIERQEPIDDSKLSPKDNLEEYGVMGERDLEYWKSKIERMYSETSKAIIASFGGTALGDVAFIPGMGLKKPRGIRSVAEWYMSTVIRQDYINSMFEQQIDLAIDNYKKLWDKVGDKVTAVVICGTDFGSQDSQFCSPETFRELWLPHYKRLNDWIHKNTSWKTFKHSCGAIVPILPGLIEAGFDIINPVQINAKGMDSKFLKSEFGKDLVFWGGGVDTQRVLAFGTPDEVRRQVYQQCEILGEGGGFIFNAVHNIQANVPVENVIAMFETLKEINGR